MLANKWKGRSIDKELNEFLNAWDGASRERISNLVSFKLAGFSSFRINKRLHFDRQGSRPQSDHNTKNLARPHDTRANTQSE